VATAAGSILRTPNRRVLGSLTPQNLLLAFRLSPQRPFYKPCLNSSIILRVWDRDVGVGRRFREGAQGGRAGFLGVKSLPIE
jgi:hypothetical protein